MQELVGDLTDYLVKLDDSVWDILSEGYQRVKSEAGHASQPNWTLLIVSDP